MMRTIEVSDEAYRRLKLEAEARGMTVETYVEGPLDEPDFIFTAEHLAAIDRAKADIASGRLSSWDDAERWTSAHQAIPDTDKARWISS